jgi:hypothetical protein
MGSPYPCHKDAASGTSQGTYTIPDTCPIWQLHVRGRDVRLTHLTRPSDAVLTRISGNGIIGSTSRLACLEPLVDEMKDGPMEKVLAKDDVELALEFLMGKRKF